MKIIRQTFLSKNIMTLLLTGALGIASMQASALIDDTHLTKAVHSDIRLEKDIARDVNRKPANIMAFSNVKEGQTIVDMIAGGGYYSELFSLAVGETGTVYTHMSRADEARTALFTNMKTLSDFNLADFTGQADLIFTALNYHDTVNSDKFDRPAMMANIKAHLKEDGVFVIIDHAAAAGSGISDTNTLHRIDKDYVINEVVSAGFVLDGESVDLESEKDDHTLKVFDPSMRGMTDRFVLRFKVAK